MKKYRMIPADSLDTPDEAAASNQKAALSVDQMLEHVGFGRFQIKILMLTGLCWMADAVEMIILSYLMPEAQKEFDLTPTEESLLGSAVFLGMWLGLTMFGIIADKKGRRGVYFVSMTLVLVCGVLSAFAQNYAMLVTLRVLVGIGVGGSGVAFTMFSEFLPMEQRGKYLVYLEAFWTVGSLIGAGIAWITLSSSSWRAMVGYAALPTLIPLILFPWLPESPRYLVQVGKEEEAYTIFRNAAIQNGQQIPDNVRVSIPMVRQTGHVSELFSPEFRKTTVFLLLLAFVNCFAYYGLLLVTPQYFSKDGDADNAAYLEVFIVSAAEFPGIVISALMINRIGRKYSQAILLICTAVTTFLLLIPTADWALTIFAMIARMSILGAYSTLLVYTVEVFPTRLRGTGYGVCGAFSRVAGVITPFVANSAVNEDYTVPLAVYGSFAFAAAIIAVLLPRDTTGVAIDAEQTDKKGYAKLKATAED